MAERESADDEISLEESLLLCSRRGQTEIIRGILQSRREGKIDFDINCKGTQKSNRGWTPLHLAAYFGHADIVELLLQYGACVNEVNNVGDTALHKAAHTGRQDVVMLLLQSEADVSVMNAEGHRANSLAKTQEILKLIEAAEHHDACRREEQFLSLVRLGQVEQIEHLVSDGKVSNMNCQDSFGNTALHVAAQADQREVAVYLLQKGLDSGTKNKHGMLASQVARTEQMRHLLNVQPKKDAIKLPAMFEGLLLKKKFVGSTAVWVVLERGVLSYFKNRGDATTGSKRRGMKYLDNAQLRVSETNSNEFGVHFSDGTFHKLGVDPGASEVRLGRDPATGKIVTTQMWLNSLKDHIAYNTHYIHKWEMLQTESKGKLPLLTMQEALRVSQAHQDVLQHHVTHLCDYLASSQNSTTLGNLSQVEGELQKMVKYSQDTCSSLNKCLTLFTQEQEDRECVLHEEREKNRVLQEALHALALEHRELERSYSHNARARNFSVDDDDFFDCDDDLDNVDIHLPLSPKARSVMSDALSFKSCQFNVDSDDEQSHDATLHDSTHNFQLFLGGRKDIH